METDEKNFQVEKCNKRKPALFDSLKDKSIYLISQNDYVVTYYLVKALTWPKYYLAIVRFFFQLDIHYPKLKTSGPNQPFATSAAKIVTDE